MIKRQPPVADIPATDSDDRCEKPKIIPRAPNSVTLFQFGVTGGQGDLPTSVVIETAFRTKRKKATEEAYLKRTRQLMRRYLKEQRGCAGMISDTAFVAWLIELKPRWAARTWRVYKAGVCAIFQREIALLSATISGQTSPDQARSTARIAALGRVLERLEAEGTSSCAAMSTATSAAKAKALSENERAEILAALRGIRSRYARELDDYLLAGTRTGLRPAEWAETRPSVGLGGELVLRVRNAKHDGVRGNGATRTLVFTHLPNVERAAILRWLGRVHAAGDDAGRLMVALGDLLRRATRRAWPRRKNFPSLYSVRHAFAALCKLAYTPAEVAALMGHASDVTATHHYGRRRGGRTLPPEIQALIDRLPRPEPREVALVRQRFAAKRERLKLMRDMSVVLQFANR